MRAWGFAGERRRRLGLSAGLLAAWLAVTPAAADPAALRERIDAALAKLGPHPTAAVRVVSLTRGEVLYERNPDLSLNPASNMKLFTLAAVLARLGPDYRFTTRALGVGPVQDGTLKGNLVLQGGGDPVLETPDLEKLADSVKQAGVRRVAGMLVADDYRFDAERLGIGWNSDDEPFYYSAQISALSVNRNVLTLDITPGKKPGAPAEVTVKPLPHYVRVTARPTTGPAASTTRLSISRSRARNEVQVTGTIAADASPVTGREVTMEDPHLFTASLFKKLLRERGIEVTGGVVRAPAPEGATEIAKHVSRPLSEIGPLLNKPSDNLIAEMLLKEIGYAVRKKGDAVNGSEVVEAWLKETGIARSGVVINDGSGLSRMDLVTARAVSELLAHADRQPWGPAFMESLPVAGVDGTLRSRFKSTAAEKNLKAKTGSLSHVTALGGYVTSAGGERFLFSVLINNYIGPLSGANGAKRIEDEIGVALAEDR